MALEHVFSCPMAVQKFRSTPLGKHIEGFCGWMLEKTEAPAIESKAQWHEPEILGWLNNLSKDTQLCEVKL